MVRERGPSHHVMDRPTHALLLACLLITPACASPEPDEAPEPGVHAKASLVSLALVFACRKQAEECAKQAREHPCRLGDASCMTADECNAQAITCISDALNQ